MKNSINELLKKEAQAVLNIPVTDAFEKAVDLIIEQDFAARVPVIDGTGMEGFGQIGESINAMAEELSQTERLKNEFISSISSLWSANSPWLFLYGSWIISP